MTVAVQLNVPVAETVAEHPETVAPALMEAVIEAPGVKPVPERVTVAPLGPWVGAIERAGAVTRKEAVAASKLPSDPVAVTVYDPGVPELMVTVQENVPAAETVAPQLVMLAPDPTDVVTVRPGVNPDPETVTLTPLGPWVGASVIDGVVTLKSAVAESKLPSEPAAMTV